jgi:hypothetical protein
MSATQFNSWLYVWDDGDNPGAGSKSVDSAGLNGNWIKLDVAIQAEHTVATGVHKANVIDGPNLKTTAADASTIELAGSPLKLRIKDLGVSSAKIAANAVIAGKLADGAVETAARIVDAIITGAKLVAGTITGTQLADDAVTAPKISHDNHRTKIFLSFSFAAITSLAYAKVNGEATSSSLGVPIPRAGSVTGIIWHDGNSVNLTAIAYGTYVFAASSYITVRVASGAGSLEVVKNGTALFTCPMPSYAPCHVILEIELDD